MKAHLQDLEAFVFFLTMGIKRKLGVIKVLMSTNLVVKFKNYPLNTMSSLTQ